MLPPRPDASENLGPPAFTGITLFLPTRVRRRRPLDRMWTPDGITEGASTYLDLDSDPIPNPDPA